MFDSNVMKKKVKEWMKVHPHGSEKDLQDFCEELVPPQHYFAQKWLIDHTLAWYRYVLEHRRQYEGINDDETAS